VKLNKDRLKGLTQTSRLQEGSRLRLTPNEHGEMDPYSHWTFPDDSLEAGTCPSYMMVRRLCRRSIDAPVEGARAVAGARTRAWGAIQPPPCVAHTSDDAGPEAAIAAPGKGKLAAGTRNAVAKAKKPKALFNKVVKVDSYPGEYFFVLTYLPDLQWCHLAPLRRDGIFTDKSSAKGHPKWVLVPEGEAQELDIAAPCCTIVKARAMRRCADADKEEWDIDDTDCEGVKAAVVLESAKDEVQTLQQQIEEMEAKLRSMEDDPEVAAQKARNGVESVPAAVVGKAVEEAAAGDARALAVVGEAVEEAAAGDASAPADVGEVVEEAAAGDASAPADVGEVVEGAAATAGGGDDESAAVVGEAVEESPTVGVGESAAVVDEAVEEASDGGGGDESATGVDEAVEEADGGGGGDGGDESAAGVDEAPQNAAGGDEGAPANGNLDGLASEDVEVQTLQQQIEEMEAKLCSMEAEAATAEGDTASAEATSQIALANNKSASTDEAPAAHDATDLSDIRHE